MTIQEQLARREFFETNDYRFGRCSRLRGNPRSGEYSGYATAHFES